MSTDESVIQWKLKTIQISLKAMVHRCYLLFRWYGSTVHTTKMQQMV